MMWHLKSRDASAHPLPPEFIYIGADQRDRDAAAQVAGDGKWRVTLADSLTAGNACAAAGTAAVIFIDRDLVDRDIPESDWRSTVHVLAGTRSSPCVVLASSVIDDYLFEEVVKQGGFDILAKPVQTDELRRTVSLALAYWKSRQSKSFNG